MKILIATSTLPISDDDKVPAFVKDQAIALKKNYPETEIIIQAPHNVYSQTARSGQHCSAYQEVRFHYFWPYRLELLTGRGILPALRQNKLLYLQIPFLFFFQFISLLTITRKQKPDLIYAHWFTPQAINAALVSKITNTPFIFTTHASDVLVLKKLPFLKKLVAWVCGQAGAYTAVSGRTAEKLISFFTHDEWNEKFRHKLSIIPMGVGSSISRASNQTSPAALDIFGIPKDKKYVLFLGRLAEKKGVSYLLQAWSQLPRNIHEKYHLIIAGDGQLKPKLERQSQELEINNITFTGYVTGQQKNIILALADFACFPSIIDDSGDSEGFPVAIMECLAADKIVLSSNVTGAENIINNSVNGFVFTQKSPEALTEALLSAFQLTPKNRRKMQKAASSLKSRFDWDEIARQHYIIFKNAASDT